MTTMTDNAENQAKAQLESIQAMMVRLTHAQVCDDWETCDLDGRIILQGIDEFSTYRNYPQMAEREQGERYNDEDEARERIDEDPLSIQVRSDWVDPYRWNGPGLKAAEYEILLMTGGPAVRIIGSLDEHGEPDRARLQYQDWGTPWTELLNPRDTETLVTYASTFYFDS